MSLKGNYERIGKEMECRVGNSNVHHEHNYSLRHADINGADV